MHEMKAKITILISVIATFSLITFLSSFTSKEKLSVEGAWSFVEVKTVKPDGATTLVFPKEGVAIFSGNNYSFCWTSHDFKSRSWQVADSVKLNRFNQSIVNTGTFTLKDSILTTKAIFAMTPMFSNGGVAKFKCSFSGDTLVLRGLSVVSSENIAHPAYAGGTYFVSKLLRVSNNK
jgi:hypothetical protein